MAKSASLDTVEIETAPHPIASIIWMHGLGADGHDFEPIVPELASPQLPAVRFVFPNAPIRPITVNAGYPMRAWFDVIGFGRTDPQDEPGIRASAAAIRALIQRENERGVSTQRIVLAGFSQGGAMAVFTGIRHSERLAGIMGLSCFETLPATMDTERAATNQSTPIFLAHGVFDPLVDIRRGRELRAGLEKRGYTVEWHEYPMPHSVAMEEINAIAGWLPRVLTSEAS
jgi:phospholipase/carboxylesterase